MNAARFCFVAAALAGLAIILVHLRSEQMRAGASLLRLEHQWIELRSEWWALQTRAARLRCPQRIADRARYLRAGPVPPEIGQTVQLAARHASSQPQE